MQENIRKGFVFFVFFFICIIIMHASGLVNVFCINWHELREENLMNYLVRLVQCISRGRMSCQQ